MLHAVLFRLLLCCMELSWAPELEVALFHSLHGHKPVGELGSSAVDHYGLQMV